jgi:MFS superfamily sulfate permease-like transporter
MHTPDSSASKTSRSSALLSCWKQDLLASLVVFLVALPLCMGIALASGAPVSAGLITGIVGGLLVGSLAGSPLQVSGPAAGLTVVCGEVIRQSGMPGLGLAVLTAGVLQFLAGVFRLGQWFRAVSPAVIHGMLSGIGILILSSQLHVLVDDRPRETAVRNIMAIPGSLEQAISIGEWEEPEVRRSRISLLRTVNQLYDQQKSLARSIDREILPSESDASVSDVAALPPHYAGTQQKLSDELAKVIRQAEDGPLSKGDSPGARQFRERMSSAASSADTALVTLRSGNADRITLHNTQSAAVTAVANLLVNLKQPTWAGKIGLLAVIVIMTWQWLARGAWKLIPAPLLAIVIVTALAQAVSLPVLYVDVPDSLLSGITLPTMESLQTLPLRQVVISGLVLAIIASAETLLCATAVDQMHTGPRTRYDQELAAQGLGNTICGLLGVLPMTGVIVRSAANVQAGGRTRLSAVLHGCWLLLFTWALTPVLRLIPTSALAGILVYTGFRLIDFRGFIHLWRSNRPEAIIFLITLVVIVVEDLLAGVLTGIVLSALRLLLRFSWMEIQESTTEGINGDHPRVTLSLVGAATFLRLPVLAARLEKVPAGAELHVDLTKLDYIDHACLDLLINWAKQHAASGGKLDMDWESLHASFEADGKTSRS